MPTFPSSSSGRFNVPSKVARKGNGKNLATRKHLLTAPYPFAALPPFSFGRQYAMENYKTSLRRNNYGDANVHAAVQIMRIASRSLIL